MMINIKLTAGIFRLALPSSLLMLNIPAHAQSDYTILKLDDASPGIILDGLLDETEWLRADLFDDLIVVDPDTLTAPAYRTEVRAFYTDEGLYIGAINFQPESSLVARLSARDARVRRDAFSVSIDPSGQGLYGFNMRVHLGGSVSDSTILPERQMSRDWDGPWQSATAEIEGGWSAEIFIPWSMLPLPAADGGRRDVGLYFERTVAHLNQTWSWPALPNTTPEFLSAFAKFALVDITPRPQVVFYPYASWSFNNMTKTAESRAGADFYWRPTSNTRISAAIDPDFGTVESDDIVVNLGAFETFFSEKRAFFLEGNEIFQAHPRATGQSPLTMLNTRRIGAAANYTLPAGFSYETTERNRPVDLIGAAKITGQLGALRYGVMLASEEDSELRGTMADGSRATAASDGNDFYVARMLYETTSGGGRQSIGWMATKRAGAEGDATVNGMDFHHFSASGKWSFDGQLLRSDVNNTRGTGVLADLVYSPGQGVTHSFTGTHLDKKLNLNDAGYMRRNDEMGLDYAYRISRSGFTNYRTRETNIRVINQWNTDGHPVRTGLFADREYTFHNNNTFTADVRYYPPRIDDRASRGYGSYRIPSRFSAETRWRSDGSRAISYQLTIGNSQEDLKGSNIVTSASITWQPDDRLFVENEVSYGDRESLLVRSSPGYMTAFQANEWNVRVNTSYFLTSRQQVRMSLQWTGLKAMEDKNYLINQDRISSLRRVEKPSEAAEDFSVSRLSFQIRYQWEIAPLSDFFVVYTRGNNLDNNPGDSFQNLFYDAWTDRISDTFVAKIRYRFGG